MQIGKEFDIKISRKPIRTEYIQTEPDTKNLRFIVARIF